MPARVSLSKVCRVYTLPKDVHFTDAGSEVLADHTATMILEILHETAPDHARAGSGRP